jgi:AmiR/NasT family two-component response regulator
MTRDELPTDGVRVASHVDGVNAPQRIAELEREVAQLRLGLATREQIGVATGIVAERLRISPENAFLILRAASQNCNVKLRDVARIVTEEHCGRVAESDRRLAEELHYWIFGQHERDTYRVRA